MSGGHFDYNQFRIVEIADEINRLIDSNNTINEYGYARNYNPETIKAFKTIEGLLNETATLVHHLDYLVEGDIGEYSFVDEAECKFFAIRQLISKPSD
jgi:hypothetical protein